MVDSASCLLDGKWVQQLCDKTDLYYSTVTGHLHSQILVILVKISCLCYLGKKQMFLTFAQYLFFVCTFFSCSTAPSYKIIEFACHIVTLQHRVMTWNLIREVQWQYSIMLHPRPGSSVWHAHLGLNLFFPSSVLYRYTSHEIFPAPKAMRWDKTSKTALGTKVCGPSFGRLPWLLLGPQ